MNTWFRRAVGTVGIAGGVLLLGAGAAHADDSVAKDPQQLHGLFDDLLSPTGGTSGMQLAQVHKGQLPTDSLPTGTQVPGVLGALPISDASKATGLATVDGAGTESAPVTGGLPLVGGLTGGLPGLGGGGLPGIAQLPTGGLVPGQGAPAGQVPPVSDLGRTSPLGGLPGGTATKSVTGPVSSVGRTATGPAATVVGGRHRVKPVPAADRAPTGGATESAAEGVTSPLAGLPGGAPTAGADSLGGLDTAKLLPSDSLPTNGIQSNDVPIFHSLPGSALSGVGSLPRQAHLNGVTPADALSGVAGAPGRHRAAAAHAAQESAGAPRSQLGVAPKISPAAASHLPVIGGFLRSVPTSQLSSVPVPGGLLG